MTSIGEWITSCKSSESSTYSSWLSTIIDQLMKRIWELCASMNEAMWRDEIWWCPCSWNEPSLIYIINYTLSHVWSHFHPRELSHFRDNVTVDHPFFSDTHIFVLHHHKACKKRTTRFQFLSHFATSLEPAGSSISCWEKLKGSSMCNLAS